MNTFTCDVSGKEVPVADKHWVLTTRPSCPEEIVSVMWVGPDDAERVGAVDSKFIKELEKQFDEKGYCDFEGKKCLWLTI